MLIPRICVCTAPEAATAHTSLLMVVTAGAMAVGGGLLTVVSLRVVESVTMLLVWAHAGAAANMADMMAHLPRLVILLLIFSLDWFCQSSPCVPNLGTSCIFNSNPLEKILLHYLLE